MKKVKELKVFRIVDAEYDGCQSGSNTVYICRGWACNVLRTYYRGCSIKEERLANNPRQRMTCGGSATHMETGTPAGS